MPCVAPHSSAPNWCLCPATAPSPTRNGQNQHIDQTLAIFKLRAKKKYRQKYHSMADLASSTNMLNDINITTGFVWTRLKRLVPFWCFYFLFFFWQLPESASIPPRHVSNIRRTKCTILWANIQTFSPFRFILLSATLTELNLTGDNIFSTSGIFFFFLLFLPLPGLFAHEKAVDERVGWGPQLRWCYSCFSFISA